MLVTDCITLCMPSVIRLPASFSLITLTLHWKEMKNISNHHPSIYRAVLGRKCAICNRNSNQFGHTHKKCNSSSEKCGVTVRSSTKLKHITYILLKTEDCEKESPYIQINTAYWYHPYRAYHTDNTSPILWVRTHHITAIHISLSLSHTHTKLS
jgi:hypothetical protein